MWIVLNQHLYLEKEGNNEKIYVNIQRKIVTRDNENEESSKEKEQDSIVKGEVYH